MSETMDGLIEAMSDEDIEGLKVKFEGNTSINTLIDGIIESRKVEAEKAKVLTKFTADIAKTYEKLGHPDGIHNVYARWSEVDIPDLSVEPTDVNIIDTPAILDKDGNIITPAETHTEPRRPTIKGWKWVVSVNHADKVSSGGSTPGTKQGTSKRAITVYERNKAGADTNKGNYPSASKACESLGIPTGGDSAMRVLTREGYYTEAFEG